MSTKFIAIDFETANPALSSICQVGLVTFEDGKVVNSWGTLVNPQDYFDWMNVDIHGIDEKAVKNAPTFPQIYPEMLEHLQNNVVVCHTTFDRAALSQAVAKHSLNSVSCQWLDSARVVRRAWSQWAYKGYGLTNVCSALGISFSPHDAVEDARAAGEVLLRAIEATGMSLEEWMLRTQRPINPEMVKCIAMDGNPDGPLSGEEIVFTGTLTLPRRDAAALAANAGCDVAPSVRKTTTLLIVGDYDLQRLEGYPKSTKHRKAEELIAKGQSIRILGETDFLRLLDLTG